LLRSSIASLPTLSVLLALVLALLARVVALLPGRRAYRASDAALPG